jgi:RNA polymerase sigma-70 factor (ECF subfamily)
MGGSRSGGENDFARLLQETHDRLFGFIFSMVQNRADAEDIFQQTALVLWKKFPEYRLGTNFVAWSMRVAQYEIKDYIKARRRCRLFFSDDILDAIAVTFQEDQRGPQASGAKSLTKCIDKLSERDRSILMRCYAVDRDYAEIAKSEGKTLSATYKAISRIRKALYACVQRAMATETQG